MFNLEVTHLRDYIAIEAMKAYFPHTRFKSELAKEAYEMADYMIAARSKPPKEVTPSVK